jgi:hypothetical protein
MNPKRLIIVLDRVRRFLEKYDEPYGLIIADLMARFTNDPDLLKENVRSLFGAMGSLTDIWISKYNGHDVEYEQEANLEFRAFRQVLWQEVEDPVRDRVPDSARHLVKVFPTTHVEAEEAFESHDLETVFDALVWMTYYDDDSSWVQAWCLSFTYHSNPGLRVLATSCLADLAKLHKALDRELVLSRLSELLSDPDVRDPAEDALREINSVLT